MNINERVRFLVEEASVGGQMTQSVFSKGVFCEFQGLTDTIVIAAVYVISIHDRPCHNNIPL